MRTKEELEKEEREKMQAEVRKQLQQNRRSFHRLAKSSKPQPVKHSKPTTEPVGFNFRTDERCRRKTISRPPSASNASASAFPMLLRSRREVSSEVSLYRRWGGREGEKVGDREGGREGVTAESALEE